MNKNKVQKISVLEFKPLRDKKEKEEIIQWLVDNSPFFRHIPLPADLKIKISEPLPARKPLFLFPMWGILDQLYDFYIIKYGNAFSWMTKAGLGVSSHKTWDAQAVKRRGAILEIFSPGDVIIFGIDIPAYFSLPMMDMLDLGKENILAGLPFGKSIWPLEVIKIEQEEIERVFFNTKTRELSFKNYILNYVIEQLNLYKWRLAGHLSTSAEAKILSVLYLCFLGQIPLEYWIVRGEQIDNEGVPKKPREVINGFRISRKELALFSGVNPRTITDILGSKGQKQKKGIFEKDKLLAKFFILNRLSGEDYKFTAIPPKKDSRWPKTDPLSFLERRVLHQAHRITI